MITPKTPIVVAVPVTSTEEKSFPNLWVRTIHIESRTNTVASVACELLPCSDDGTEFAPESAMVRLQIPNAFALEAFTPKLQAAMAAIMAAIEEARL